MWQMGTFELRPSGSRVRALSLTVHWPQVPKEGEPRGVQRTAPSRLGVQKSSQKGDLEAGRAQLLEPGSGPQNPRPLCQHGEQQSGDADR